MKFFFCCFLMLNLVGCASSTPQTEALLMESRGLPKSVLIPGVPFIQQSANFCGPATLAMALHWAGKNVSLDELATQVYTPEMKGSLPTDMVGASRRQGLVAVPIEGLHLLLNEVAAGHPVIVFENLSVSWLPQWHYAIVIGYDLSRQIVHMHSGPEAFKQWDLRKFERSWKLGKYWGLVVLPAGSLAVTAGELANVKATAALEQAGKISEAAKSYQQILKHWPKSLGAKIGLGNIAYSKNQIREAVKILQQATEDHPQSSSAWHNLAIAQGAANMKSDAKYAASQAMKLATAEEKSTFSQDLQEVLQ